MNGNNANAMGQMANGTNGVQRLPESTEEMKQKLNTYIYDYFLRHGEHELARSLWKSKLQLCTTPAKTAAQRKANGEDNGEDAKDDLEGKKPQDLPYPAEIPPGATENSFLLDWFQIFWEMFFANRKNSPMKITPATTAYMQHQKDQQQMIARQGGMPNGMIMNYPGMMGRGQPGMAMGARNMQQNPNMRNIPPAMMARTQQQQQIMQNQAQMAREGSDVDMTDPGMMAQGNFNNFPGQNQKKNLDAYSQNLAQTVRQNMPQGIPQSMMQGGAMDGDFYAAGGNNAMRGQMPQNGAPQNPGNHALQDYQMQLMLLEQQNKKRLLMARQEQEQVRPPGDQVMGGQTGYAPNMSPQGSRSGPSPNPSEQMKRGTPKMGQAGLPGGPNSPMPDGNMVHARASPGAMNYGMEMMQQGMKGVDGMPLGPGMRPPSSHPGFPAGNPAAQMEAIRAAQQAGRIPNGAGWPGMQGQAPGMPQGIQPGQQMGTPQPRNVAMPPPQNVPPQNGVNGRPASPAQSAAAGTPQPANKAAPAKKGKAGKDNKKQPAKKGPAAATPSADDNPPQTPTPATPITPMHPNSFKDGKGINGAGQMTSGQPNNNVAAPAQPHQDPHAFTHFDNMPMDIEPPTMALGFSNLDTGDVLEQFDFDQFLDPGDPNDMTFTDLGSYPGFEGLEAGAGDT